MSVTWHNVYKAYLPTILQTVGNVIFGHANESPNNAQWWSDTNADFVRVEQRWDGYWLRPPVGMRSAQASHAWVRSMSPGQPFGNGFSFRLGPWRLEARGAIQNTTCVQS